MAKQLVVPGHGLWFEGAPHDDAGHRKPAFYGGVSGEGRAKCRCGEMSDVLPSGGQRKKWHAEHKAKVAAERAKEQA